MNNNATIGVFLCQCGNNIAPRIDLKSIENELQQHEHVAHCEIYPFPCIKPGLEHINQMVARKSLNRVIVAGCEGRLMLKKFEQVLRLPDLHKGQIDMINLRGHVAAVSNLEPSDNARKGAKLIKAAIAEMVALAPSPQTLARIDGPVFIIGDGLSVSVAAFVL